MSEAVPIAIIGLGCCFPGDATNPEDFWRILSKGQCTWSDVPPGRFNWKSYYDDDPERSGTTNHRGGHFLRQDIAAFDARFFGISAADAIAIDPQQRIQLETTYEALESAGIPIEKIRGSRTGVYIATFNHDYENIIYRELSELPKYAMTGTGQALAANRISYIFDLQGPSFALDTGCSGSLVALHQACQSLRSGESEMAIVGGTNLTLSPEVLSPMSNLHVLNKDGKCYSFDSRGSGYGRGEGSGTLVLKRLDDALESGDPIRAVIRNTACNQDGKTNGITYPSSQAQEALIRFAYQSSGLHPDDTHYFEAHGTGTIAGDKAEIDAIGNVFGNRSPEHPLHVGSVKGNIGHLENASGVAGIIKTVLVLEKGYLPPNANVEILKSDLELKGGRIDILRTLKQLPLGFRRASVNSFGYGGTNAHAILETYHKPDVKTVPKLLVNGNLHNDNHDTSFLHSNGSCCNGSKTNHKIHNAQDANEDRELAAETAMDLQRVTENPRNFSSDEVPLPRLFVLTAKSQKSLSMTVERLHGWVSEHQNSHDWLENLAYTLSLRRSIMSWRFTFVASTVEDLKHVLSSGNGRFMKASSAPLIVFLFTGQGSQYLGMASELCQTDSKFKESLQRSERILLQLGAPWHLITELLADNRTSRINESEIAQPATTAIQIALVDLLMSLGIKPSAVLGHSSGEIAAAYAVGALSREAAITVSYRRSFLARVSKSILQTEGAMLAVGLGEQQILDDYPSNFRKGTIVVACVNSPSSITVSGDKVAVLELKDALDQDSVFNRLLKVQMAYHSHHMGVVSEDYLKSLDGLGTSSPDPTIQFFSSVTGYQKYTDFGPSYWVQNLVSQVKFSDALAELCQKLNSVPRNNHPLFLEIGPHSTLAGPFRQSVASLSLTEFTPSSSQR